MAEAKAGHYRYYVAPRKNGNPGDGTPERPLASVREALESIARRHGGAAPSVKKLGGYDRVDICSVPSPAQPLRRGPRYEFYVDPLGAADGLGTGTDSVAQKCFKYATAGGGVKKHRTAVLLEHGRFRQRHQLRTHRVHLGDHLF